MPKRFDTLVDDVVASPLGGVISAVGQGVADAQRALDEASLASTLEIYGGRDDETLELLRRIGYQPTFYALPETTGEVKVSLNLSGSGQPGGKNAAPRFPSVTPSVRPATPRMYAMPVNASVSNRYSYSASVAASISFKIVPVPPPAESEALRAVPDFTIKDPPAAREAARLLRLGLRFVRDGEAVETPGEDDEITAQMPASGEIVRVGDEIELTLG